MFSPNIFGSNCKRENTALFLPQSISSPLMGLYSWTTAVLCTKLSPEPTFVRDWFTSAYIIVISVVKFKALFHNQKFTLVDKLNRTGNFQQKVLTYCAGSKWNSEINDTSYESLITGLLESIRKVGVTGTTTPFWMLKKLFQYFFCCSR